MSDENLDLGQSRGPDDLFGDLGKKNSPLTSPGFTAPAIDLDVDSPTIGRRILSVMASPALLFGSIALAIVGLIAGFIPSSWSNSSKFSSGVDKFPIQVVITATGSNLIKKECLSTPRFGSLSGVIVSLESQRKATNWKRDYPLGNGELQGSTCLFRVNFPDSTQKEGAYFNVIVGEPIGITMVKQIQTDLTIDLQIELD